MTPELNIALARLMQESAGYGPVLKNTYGEPITARGLQRVLAELGERVGHPGLSARTLRAVWTRSQSLAGRSASEIAAVGGFSSYNVVRKRMGILGVDSRPCEACGGRPNPGPVDARCAACLGTGSLIEPPASYVAGVNRQNVIQRVRAWSTEVRRLAPRLLRGGVLDEHGAAHLLATATSTWALAGALAADSTRVAPPSVKVPSTPPLVEATQRLRALGTNLRKLAKVLAERGWVDIPTTKLLERDGANVTLLAIGLEDGARSVEWW